MTDDLRPIDAVPLLVERVKMVDSSSGLSYEEARWPYLSPAFRAAHNRRRQLKGLPTIPPPKIDLYVAPPKIEAKPFDISNPEFVASVREFNGPQHIMGPRGSEGFTINGEAVK